MKDERYLEELRTIADRRTGERDYWLDKLSGELETCRFPYDYKNEKNNETDAVVLRERFSKRLSAAATKLSAGSDVRLFLILTTALTILLEKYTGKRDIMIGMPILKPEVDQGTDFTNFVVVLRNEIKEGMSFKELLLDVRQAYDEAVENQYYPVEILLEELGLPIMAGDFPLSDVAAMVESIHERDHLDHIAPNMIFSFSRVNEAVDCCLEYNANLYDGRTAARIIDHFKRLLQVALADVEIKIPEVDILSAEEKRQLLYEFNDTVTDYPKEKTIHALFEEQVEKTPGNIALVGERPSFSGQDGNTRSSQPESLTYRRLDRAAAGLAGILVRKGAGPGAVVGLSVERSIEMVVGILAVLKAGGAYLPIDPQYPQGRQEFMLKDSGAKLLLTARDLEREARKLEVETIFIEAGIRDQGLGIGVGARRAVPGTAHLHLQPAPAAGLAYIMYTSGSTGKSKGVMVEHHNVVRLVVNTNYVELNNETRILLTGAPVFDATTFEIWGALLNGGMLFLVENDVILDAGRLGSALLRNRINTLWLTSPLFNQLMQQDGTIFHSLQNLLVGGDVLSPRYINDVRNGNKKLRVINGYGPTENTTFSTTCLIDKDFTGSIPIGKPIANSTAYILDKNGSLQLPGVPGELVVGGDGIARGYLNQPELTHEKFIASGGPPFCKKVGPKTFHEGQEPEFNVGARRAVPGEVPSPTYRLIYKTGDLCRWLPSGPPAGGADKATYGGVIEFLGRRDQQVKIRGFRVEPEEIENHLLGHEDVKEAVVTVAGSSGEKYLCAYLTGDIEDESHLRLYLSERVPGYMIPSSFTLLDKMPLTTNGKIDRKALPEPEARTAGVYAAPRDDVEERMAAIWSDVLGIKRSAAADDKGSSAGSGKKWGGIGIDDNFFELGGHSLTATKLVYFIRKEFEVNIELKDVFNHSCIRSLAQIIKAAETREYTAITAVEEKEYYKMSYAQRRLWVLCQFEEESTAYNMPGAIVFAGRFDAGAFTKAIQTLTDRHESLRTVFISAAGDPYQKIIKDFKFELDQIDLRELDEKSKEEQARDIYLQDANRAFDLERGPLFRFKLLRLAEEKYLLIHNFHHIVNDGWSQGNLYNEIITLYNISLSEKANPYPPLEIQYKDYTCWHNDLIVSGRFDAPRDYWVEKFKDKPNGIELPIDHPRKPVQTFNGGRISFTIGNKETARLSNLSVEEDVTFFMTLLALVAVFLYKYSGQEDILIGSPIANRKQPELHPIVGFLVNTLVFRSRVKPASSFRQFLEEIKKETLACYEYQDYPFDLLVEQLGLDRDLSQSPLFNFMLAHNNAETEDSEMKLAGLDPLPFAYAEDFNMSKFDLIFHMNEFGDYLHPNIEYNSDLFERSTIERMVDNFLELVDSVIAKPDAPISALNVISEAEYEETLHRFNDTSHPFPVLTVTRLFENRVEQAGDTYAVIYQDDKITYNELNSRANRWAHYLRKTYRVKANDIIGISMERSIEMIVLLFGIIKSGAAYLAVDPTYPKDRVLHVLSDSRSDILITDKMRPELFGSYTGEILVIDTCRDALANEPAGNPEPVNRLSDVLYVNYTSGSTGTPNGAMLSHDCLANLIQWQNEKTTIDCSLRCLQFTSINFCVSFQEIMGTLTSGGELYLIGDIERQDIDYLLDFLSSHRIEILFLPFSYLNFLFNESSRWNREFDHHLKHIITAGEQLKVTSGLKRFLDSNPELQLHNHYGSTEMHVVTSYTLDASTADETPIPPAGKPVGNVRIYILDDHLKPVPIGVWGELFVAGRSEILGYINNDALNEEKLILHPELSEDGKRLYRSGDSGRWLEDGNIELRGRKDYLVKVRGFRVELGEIESKLLAIDRVRECVVVDREDAAGQKYLAAYVVKENIDVDEINRILGNDLPLYMIPQIVTLDNLPLMPNGKVDRDKLPEPEQGSDKAYRAPATRLEKGLTEIWSDVLGTEAEQISVTANFFELGGHSLRATLMVSRIQKKLDRKVPLKEIFKAPTIRELAGYIAAAQAGEFTAIEPAAEKEYYPLSPAQERIFLIYRMEEESTGYNMPAVMVLQGALDREKLAAVFRKLIDRHESLRTSFMMNERVTPAAHVDDEPVQRIHSPKEIEFEIEYYDTGSRDQGLPVPETDRRGLIHQTQRPAATQHLASHASGGPLFEKSGAKTSHEGPSGLNKSFDQTFSKVWPPAGSPKASPAEPGTVNYLIDRFIRPFDLSAAPLVRAGLIPREDGTHILMIDMHHIISDGTSLGVLTSEFMVLYSGEELPPLRIQYKDFSEWQNSAGQKERTARQEEYWMSRFAGDIPVLELPYDFPRPTMRSYEGETIRFEFSEAETEGLNKIALEQETTLYMVLLAIFYVFLQKIGGGEDIVVGTPTAGRRHADLEPLIGMFINTLCIRNYPREEKRFSDFLQEVKTRTLEAFENQDYPFEDLVEQLGINWDVSRNPLFDVMFVLQNMDLQEIHIPGLKLLPYSHENPISKFDLLLMSSELSGKLIFALQYSTKLFRKEKIDRFIGYIREVMTRVSADVDIELSRIKITSGLTAPTSDMSREFSEEFEF